jgi:hypothetical protein
MMSVPDLLQILDEERPSFLALFVVIAFDDRSVPVSADEPDRSNLLTNLFAEGGEPIGMIGATQSDGVLTISHQMFEGFEWAGPAMDKLIKTLGVYLSRYKGGPITSRWLN